MEQIKAWYAGLDEKDQKVTLVASVVFVALMLYLLVIEPINSSASKLQSEVAAKQKTVDWMKAQIPIILASKSSGGARASSLALSSVVNNTTNKYALPVSRRDSKSPNEMQVWFDNVSFDSFLGWVSEIKQKHGVTVTSVNIRSQDRDGITSINVKLLK
jgi:general secretion pathway protein M